MNTRTELNQLIDLQDIVGLDFKLNCTLNLMISMAMAMNNIIVEKKIYIY